MWDLYGPALAAVYAKGQFHDIAFAKFSTPADRDSALRLLQQRQYKEGGNNVWMKADKPLDVRGVTVIGIRNETQSGRILRNPQNSIWAIVKEEEKIGGL